MTGRGTLSRCFPKTGQQQSTGVLIGVLSGGREKGGTAACTVSVQEALEVESYCGSKLSSRKLLWEYSHPRLCLKPKVIVGRNFKVESCCGIQPSTLVLEAESYCGSKF